MDLLRRLVNFVLYGSLWISAAAGAQVQLTYLLISNEPRPDRYTLFVMLGTLLLYSAHRLIGMETVRQFEWKGRFAVIRRYRKHIAVYGILAFLGGLYTFITLERQVQLPLLVPLTIGLLYVSPVLPRGRRMRDLPFIKIFLIAVSWSVLTAVIPAYLTGIQMPQAFLLVFLERALFILAITVPFDIRDLDVDEAGNVISLPMKIGIRKSKVLAICALILSVATMIGLTSAGVYSSEVLPVYLPFSLTVTGLIWYSRPDLSDYYYSGILDGSLLMLPVLYAVFLELS